MSFKGCHSYCKHGGVCTLEPGHEGKHNSTYCDWTDEEALTRDQANDVLALDPAGAAIAMFSALFDPNDDWVPEEGDDDWWVQER